MNTRATSTWVPRTVLLMFHSVSVILCIHTAEADANEWLQSERFGLGFLCLVSLYMVQSLHETAVASVSSYAKHAGGVTPFFRAAADFRIHMDCYSGGTYPSFKSWIQVFFSPGRKQNLAWVQPWMCSLVEIRQPVLDCKGLRTFTHWTPFTFSLLWRVDRPVNWVRISNLA